MSETSPMQADLSEIDGFIQWLQEHKDLPKEDLRLDLMYSWFRPRALRAVGYFRRDRDRYLRREVVDRFLEGKEVNLNELREGVLGLCLGISAMGDAVWSAQKREDKQRHRSYLPRRTRKLIGG